MVYNNILEAVGHTPMVRLNKMVDEDSAEILVKFEGVNVGGSIKTRTAQYDRGSRKSRHNQRRYHNS